MKKKKKPLKLVIFRAFFSVPWAYIRKKITVNPLIKKPGLSIQRVNL